MSEPLRPVLADLAFLLGGLTGLAFGLALLTNWRGFARKYSDLFYVSNPFGRDTDERFERSILLNRSVGAVTGVFAVVLALYGAADLLSRW